MAAGSIGWLDCSCRRVPIKCWDYSVAPSSLSGMIVLAFVQGVAVVQRAFRGQDPALAMAELGFGPLQLIKTLPVKMSGEGALLTRGAAQLRPPLRHTGPTPQPWHVLLLRSRD